MKTASPKKWKETAEHFKKVTDGAGMHLDQGIFDAVVTLNALDINTRQSCEGHIDWGLPYPWIDIEKKGGCEKQAKEWEKAQQELKQAKKQTKDDKELEPFYDEFHRAREALVNCRLEESQKIYTLLTEFYETHPIQYDSILVIEEWAHGLGRLYNHGGIFQGRRSEKDRKKCLIQYQQEMQAFTHYLKVKYCGFKERST